VLAIEVHPALNVARRSWHHAVGPTLRVITSGLRLHLCVGLRLLLCFELSAASEKAASNYHT
jgi:hypothetical protein